MERTSWLNRTFNFDFPVGHLPSILERLRGTTARINEMASQLNTEQSKLKFDNSWSFNEHVGHLSDLEPLHKSRIDDLAEGKKLLRAADMSNAATFQANHNAKDTRELITEFSRRRRELISALEKLDETQQHASALHPRLQVTMRPVDVAIFTAEHDDHHLTSMREILKRLNKK